MSHQSLETLAEDSLVLYTSFSGSPYVKPIVLPPFQPTESESKWRIRQQTRDTKQRPASKALRAILSVEKWAFYTFRSKLSIGQRIMATPTPVPFKTKIRSISIAARNDFADLDCPHPKKTIPAEWVDYHKPSERVILYLHGGGYFMCSRKSHRALTARLSKHAHSRVIAIDYRLAPETTYPGALVDALSAYTFLLKDYDPKQIAVAGDSAGGGLATALALYLRDHDMPMPACIATAAPFLDVTQSLPSWYLNGPTDFLPVHATDPKFKDDNRFQLYVDENSQMCDPYVSPLFGQETNKPLPPMLIQVTDAERLRDDGIVFKHRFHKSPIQLEIYQEAFHVFQLWSFLDRFSKFASQRMGSFIMQHTGTNSFKPDVIREPLYIRNQEGFPIDSFEDCEAIVLDGAEQLVKQGIWKREGNEFTVVGHAPSYDIDYL
ncbi:Alpha/Beta hydrolase protein [Gorgonomyces haynaldii]|nr:Alpha/Beta hydrolase protein [Gorgonomyces haynaldii]